MTAGQRPMGRTIVRPSKAFTLIELLVIIAIICILVSILMPSLRQAKELAGMAVCLTQQRGTHTAMTMYMVENNAAGMLMISGVDFGRPRYTTQLYEGEHISSYEEIRCPTWNPHHQDMSDQEYADPTFRGSWTAANHDRGQCSEQYAYGIRGEYQVTDGPLIDGFEPEAPHYPNETHLFRPERPGACPYAADSTARGYWEPYYFNTGQVYRLNGRKWMVGAVHIRHVGGANVLYADGHAANLSYWELMEFSGTKHWMFFTEDVDDDKQNFVRSQDPLVPALAVYD